MYNNNPLFIDSKKLLDWICLDKLHFDYLSSNSNAIDLLGENKDEIGVAGRWVWD